MKNILFAAAIVLLTSSCSVGQPDIKYGSAECAHCRMNVMDKKFSAAITTDKGRSYVFDAAECMVPFVLTDAKVPETDVKNWYVADFAHPGVLIDATKAFYLHAPALKSPMNGNVAAFATAEDRTATEEEFPGEELDWDGAKKLLAE